MPIAPGRRRQYQRVRCRQEAVINQEQTCKTRNETHAPASHPHGQRDPPILFHSMTGFPHRIAHRPAKSAYSTPTRHLTSGYLRQWGSARATLRWLVYSPAFGNGGGARPAPSFASAPCTLGSAALASPPIPNVNRGVAGARWLLGSSARAGLPCTGHERKTRVPRGGPGRCAISQIM